MFLVLVILLVAVLVVQVVAKSGLVEDPTRAAAIVALMIKMRLLCVNFVNVEGIQFIIAGIVLIGSMFLQAMVLVAHVNLVPVLKNQCHLLCLPMALILTGIWTQDLMII